MPGRPELDSIDTRILALLQADSSMAIGQIAERVNLSQNACWRRIKMLEEGGVILRRVALLDADRLGVGLTVFVTFKLVEHMPDALERFARMVRDLPEAVEFHRITGEFDYLLKLQVADIAAYDRVYKRLIQTIRLSDVRACFAMEVLKQTTALPLGM
jgi:Lrp/AsnC family transcriptional regulator